MRPLRSERGLLECSPWLTLTWTRSYRAAPRVRKRLLWRRQHHIPTTSLVLSRTRRTRKPEPYSARAAALLVLMARVGPTGCCPVGIHRGRRLGRSLRSGLLCAWARRLVKLARSPRRWLFPDAPVTPSAAGAAAGTGAGAGSGADLVAGVGAVGDAPPRVVAVDVLRLLCVVWIGGATLVGLPHGLSTLSAFGWGTRAAAALSWGVGCYHCSSSLLAS